MDLLDSDGHVLSFADFKSKFHLKMTSFLHFYQVKSAISNHLLERARELITSSDSNTICDDTTSFQVDKNSYIVLRSDKNRSQRFLFAFSK